MSKIAHMYKQTLDPLERRYFNESDVQSILRDSRFWHRADSFAFTGDQVQIKENRTFLNDLKKQYFQSPQYIYGLSPSATSSWAWVTYQFAHVGFIHMFMNVFFLFIIVSVLQKHLNHEWIYSVYILSGFAGGVSYLLFNQNNEIAVIGASGAICGLMAFLSVVLNRKNIEWSYFISPLEGYFGLIYLPAFLIFPMYLISDFTTVLYNNDGVQASVAHSAHIGGTILGFLAGIAYLYDRKFKTHILNQWGKNLSREDYAHLRDLIE
ncbi:MAG: rhomboid family intramembrane serine protease [Pseudobdellovibrio sp.]